jgi:formylglycine-generating enzyme required for sulfatase activity
MPLKLIQRQAQNQYYDEVLTEGILPLRMMQIPAGTFLMGSPETELERSDSEGPQHEVSVPAFFMSKYPITQAQWRAVAKFPKVKQKLNPDPSRFKGTKRPVERVSWRDATEFCARLTVYTNREYRLPTEAEWEYACRAGTTTPFHFGETITTDLANYRGIDEPLVWSGYYEQGAKAEYRAETTPVDQFDHANAFGLADMHGNVREWCQDHWHGNYTGAPTDGTAWLTDNQAARLVLRGGSWGLTLRNCRSATRSLDVAGERNNFTGFRLVCGAS